MRHKKERKLNNKRGKETAAGNGWIDKERERKSERCSLGS